MELRKNKMRGASALLVLACLQAAPAAAQGVDPLIEGAKLCTRHLQRYETEYGIPAHLLSAIASTESGRYHEGLRIKLPWPWTINAEGKGYYFNNKEEAMAAAHKLYARGVQSMDVGCMQVNLYHHAGAFTSISQAFEPESNVAYAASFLRTLYQDGGSWKKAASDYHSKTPQRGSKYVGLVYDSWFKIVYKLRVARMNVPSATEGAMRDMQQASIAPVAAVTASSPTAPKYINVAKADTRDISAYVAPHMKTIKVTSTGSVARNEKERSSGIIVVHPDINVVGTNSAVPPVIQEKPPEPMVIADASPTAPKRSVIDVLPTVASASIPNPQARIIRIDDKIVDRHSVQEIVKKASGPNFIFND